MTKIFNEDEVTIHNLHQHFVDSGLIPYAVDGNRIRIHTSIGLAYSVLIIDEKKFIRLSSYLPLDRTQSKEIKLDFEHRLNKDIFLAKFCVDEDDDLEIVHVFPFAHGLIAGQLMALVNRFASLLDHIVENEDHDRIFNFPSSNNSDEEATGQAATAPTGILLN